jgi:hypothetical protein
MVLHGYYHRESDPAYVILAISLSCRYNKRDTDALIAFNIQSTSTIPTPTTITIHHPTMDDANEYEGAFLPDDYEEALYNDEDDPNIPVVIVDNTEQGGEHVVKLSFPGLIKFHRRNPEIKARFIDVVQKFVINNTEIAARASMILHYIVMDCVRTNRELPAEFCSRRFISQVINFTLRPPLLSDDAIHAAYGDDDFVPPFPNLTGRPWLFGYLETMIHGNIESSTILKWKAVINDSISAYASIHLRQASKQVLYRTAKEIRRQIFTPAKARPNTAPNLDDIADELVTFHRRGFQVREGVPLNEIYIKNTKGSYRHYILHFGYCLRRQEDQEANFNAPRQPHEHIHLTKKLPLPFVNVGKRNSIHIDKKGLYFILSEYRRSDVNFEANHLNHPFLPTQYNSFNQLHYCRWMKYLFRISKIVDGSKIFKQAGVGLTTNAVSASVHFIPNVTEDEELLLSIGNLSLAPREVADDKSSVDDSADVTYIPAFDGKV